MRRELFSCTSLDNQPTFEKHQSSQARSDTHISHEEKKTYTHIGCDDIIGSLLRLNGCDAMKCRRRSPVNETCSIVLKRATPTVLRLLGSIGIIVTKPYSAEDLRFGHQSTITVPGRQFAYK